MGCIQDREGVSRKLEKLQAAVLQDSEASAKARKLNTSFESRAQETKRVRAGVQELIKVLEMGSHGVRSVRMLLTSRYE